MMNVAQLRKVAKRYRLQNVTRIRKEPLTAILSVLQRIESREVLIAATTRIQRWFRRWRFVNSMDPCTLEPVSAGTAFHIVQEDGKRYKFEPVSLADYFLCSGKFENPFTKSPLSDVELRRLNRFLPEDEYPDLADVKELVRDRVAAEEREDAEQEGYRAMLIAELQYVMRQIWQWTVIINTIPTQDESDFFQEVLLNDMDDVLISMADHDNDLAIQQIENVLRDDVLVALKTNNSRIRIVFLMLRKYLEDLLEYLRLVANDDEGAPA